jgi:hypothetical protein
MRELTKRFRRVTDTTINDGGRSRRLVLTVYPKRGTLGLRPERTRREEYINLDAVYETAIRIRVKKEKAS